ncbi:hypothetical protein E2562_023896 [Oryza meyeriana var. granulata]|uniref:Uncharacterized protein n=1 Tax=Oryza meyeriana var. granulata TaxID=110450 RepID=A0A6G1D7B9_9ORYZ|nr:hypothetical protein E2562_023896 [Oryza meyeriana var. granulata]
METAEEIDGGSLGRSGAEAGDGGEAARLLGLYSLGGKRRRTGGQKGGAGRLTRRRCARSRGQKGGAARIEIGGIRSVQGEGNVGHGGSCRVRRWLTGSMADVTGVGTMLGHGVVGSA